MGVEICYEGECHGVYHVGAEEQRNCASDKAKKADVGLISLAKSVKINGQ